MKNKKIIHQLVHTLSYGDAISGEVLALQRCFQELGFDSEIYAIHEHPKLKGATKNYQELGAVFTGQIILHYSIGSPLNDVYRNLNAANRYLVYHNLTPSFWFKGVNPQIVNNIEHGARELPDLCAISDSLLADSEYNARELGELGFSASVLELPLDSTKWSLPRNEGIYSLVTSQPGIHVLHVGRLAPNKCIEDIIKSFYFLHHKMDQNSTLWLVGIDTDTELYSFSLRRLVHELDLSDNVRFVGCLADEELKSLYQTASVYVCMSEHEGYCVPLIEAMYFGLPVIAYAASAVPDTLGKGGVLLREKRHAEVAALIKEVATNSTMRESLIAAGKDRVSSLCLENFKLAVESLFMSTVSDSSVSVG